MTHLYLNSSGGCRSTICPWTNPLSFQCIEYGPPVVFAVLLVVQPPSVRAMLVNLNPAIIFVILVHIDQPFVLADREDSPFVLASVGLARGVGDLHHGFPWASFVRAPIEGYIVKALVVNVCAGGGQQVQLADSRGTVGLGHQNGQSTVSTATLVHTGHLVNFKMCALLMNEQMKRDLCT